MHSSVMNALIKLLLREIKLSQGGGRLPETVATDVPAQVLGFSGVNFCLGIRLQEVTFVTRKVLGDFFK